MGGVTFAVAPPLRRLLVGLAAPAPAGASILVHVHASELGLPPVVDAGHDGVTLKSVSPLSHH